MTEVSFSKAAGVIIQKYSHALKRLEEVSLGFSAEDLAKLAVSGDIGQMLLPIAYANTLLEKGLIQEANAIRSVFYDEQMAVLNKHIRGQANIHVAKLMHRDLRESKEEVASSNRDSCGIYNVCIEEIVPFVRVRTNFTVHSFVSSDKSGIFLIELEGGGKALYLNPQLFYSPLAQPMLECTSSKDSYAFLEIYRNFLINTFGEQNTYNSRPWLKKI